jgi:hypothetical protein
VHADFQGTFSEPDPLGSGCDTTFVPFPGECPTQVFDFFVTFDSFVLNPAGTSGTTSATVTVYTTPPQPNTAVTLSLGEIIGAGGHVAHSGTRLLGTLAATQGTTGADGTFHTTYTASIFGGEVVIFARVVGADVIEGELMQVLVSGLSSLGGGPDYNLVGAKPTHPDNHYGTSTALSNLPLIASDYRTQFYGQNQIPDADKLRYNDMTLINGGKFDLSNNWCSGCSHAEHRVGINCDVGSSNVPTNSRAALEAIFQLRGSPAFLNEGDHWHLRFQ